MAFAKLVERTKHRFAANREWSNALGGVSGVDLTFHFGEHVFGSFVREGTHLRVDHTACLVLEVDPPCDLRMSKASVGFS